MYNYIKDVTDNMLENVIYSTEMFWVKLTHPLLSITEDLT